MPVHRPTPLPRAALACLPLLLVATACTDSGSDGAGPTGGSSAPVVQLGGPGESPRPATSDDLAPLDEPAAYTPDDVAFAQAMIPHHEQALEMTAMVAAREGRTELSLLAERMEVGQRDEIAQMKDWLTARGEALPSEHAHHGAGMSQSMPGMLSSEELGRLRAARGRAFDRLFLQFMIRHHEGALLMVGDLLAGDGGQEPTMAQLAQHVDADQRVEIARMRSLLAAM